ncbi:SH3 domain-containing protein [Piscinibacter sp.]|uniref:SH3 domain-containing protein n=1 Tax=Piscinibacter sp. TaxID=1903157 RepID=UPI0039E6E840
MTRPSHRGARALAALALGMAAAGAALPALAADEAPRTERLQVTDPYLEMRTGPGRGYPIHHVAARSEWVEIELRYTDWYKVRAENGREGWVHRRQLATTLTDAGVARSFRDIAFDDYLRRRVEFGAAWGHFKKEPMLKFWAGYKLSESIGIEATLGQVQGVYSGTTFWHVNLQLEPFSDQRISPFFAAGVGNFKNIPNTSLVSATTTDAKLANASIGVRYYLTERFVLRADYSIYTAFLNDNRSGEYRALTGGLSFFF